MENFIFYVMFISMLSGARQQLFSKYFAAVLIGVFRTLTEGVINQLKASQRKILAETKSSKIRIQHLQNWLVYTFSSNSDEVLIYTPNYLNDFIYKVFKYQGQICIQHLQVDQCANFQVI